MKNPVARWRKLREPARQATVDPAGALAAVRNSRQALEDEKCRSASVQKISKSMRDMRERNHFAELIALSMLKEEKS